MARGASERAERGASFVLALLLVIVCIAISSIVIAAAATSFGHLSDQGKSDKRYNAVTSAAQLFTGSLDNSHRFEMKFEQTQTTNDGVVDGLTTKVEAPSNSSSYNFLPDITCFALCKKPQNKLNEVKTFVDVNDANSVSGTITDDLSYTVTPSDERAGVVGVTARMKSEWLLELAFTNTSSNGESFKLYMSLNGEPTMQTEVESKSTQEEVDGKTITHIQEKTTRTTTVVWTLDRIELGRGL